VGHFASTVKPVKFQVRVLVSCGLKDPEGERVDRLLAQKLRLGVVYLAVFVRRSYVHQPRTNPNARDCLNWQVLAERDLMR
jgi:hypothetical protein